MEWKDIWKEDPPRDEEILFMTMDGSLNLGILIGYEKLRKCEFFSFNTHRGYSCDQSPTCSDTVIYWLPIPSKPLCTTIPVPEDNKEQDMNIFEVIEMAKKSEHGMCWFSRKGPIHISKEGEMTPAFVNKPPTYQPEQIGPEISKEDKCCRRTYVEYSPGWPMPNGYKYFKDDGSECTVHSESNPLQKIIRID